MIPTENYLMPLLHTLIDIGNDVYGNFWDIVNSDVECLGRKEVVVCEKFVACEARIANDIEQRDTFDS